MKGMLVNMAFDINDYEEYYDDNDYKKRTKFNKTTRKIFAKKRKETKEHIENAMDRDLKREAARIEKESFFEKE